MILHITTRSRWEQAQQIGEYRADSLETEGFIHCSTPAQLLWVTQRFYSGQTGLVLLKIDSDRLQARLQFDAIATGELFSHLYGALNLDAVVQVIEFEPGADGLFQLPDAIQE
ncbi:DUF952 domain-containing protein [Phormidium sp. CLA17]|uniref:DUF952 domain-containing protein n=1 Tax=Leptolyngbya sp. Cla-17 TaxID=2803751 RepID=UPI001492512E|nr:DUF952 domain-containing protein [Leptolyngbya sp. Cla-17]MBM0742774.1 DUF952 domain-containing protein [Leptolyngbya sp. Cla-17]